MKKVLLSTVCILMIILPAPANNEAEWQEYTGQYIVSLNNSEEIMDITLQGDSTLIAFSVLGEVTLTYIKKDRFEFPQYGGIIIFERIIQGIPARPAISPSDNHPALFSNPCWWMSE